MDVTLPGSLAATCKTPTSDQITAGPETLIGTLIHTEQAIAIRIKRAKAARKRKDLNLIREDA
jgi:hypothetical protein